MSESNHIISLEEAKAMTHAYQNAPEFDGKTVASDISAGAYQEVINQSGCEGIRTYFALNEASELTIVVIGTDGAGNDLSNGLVLNRSENWPSDDDGKLALLI